MNKKEFINYVEKNKSKLQQTTCDDDLLVELYEAITNSSVNYLDNVIDGYDVKLYDIVKEFYHYDDINFVMVLEIKGELVGILTKTCENGYDFDFFYANQAQPTIEYIKSYLKFRCYTSSLPDEDDYDILSAHISNANNLLFYVDGELYMNYMSAIDKCSVNNPTLEDVLPSSNYKCFYIGDSKTITSKDDLKPIKKVGSFCVPLDMPYIDKCDVNVVMEDGSERVVNSRYILYKVIN